MFRGGISKIIQQSSCLWKLTGK